MNINFAFDQFIYPTEAPWRDNQYNEDKYQALRNQLQRGSLIEQYFAFEFERPFDAKTKYYNLLFYNLACDTINECRDKINEDEVTKRYWINTVLYRKLKTALKDVSEIIKANSFDLSLLKPDNIDSFNHINHKTDTYIGQNLKYTLIWIYLEIQESSLESIDDPLSKEDVFIQLLHEPIPKICYISEIIRIEENLKPKREKQSKATIHSFSYEKSDDTALNLDNMRDSLIHNKLISDSITSSDFRKVFQNKEVTIPITWIGSQADLKLFINNLQEHPNVSDDTKQKKWVITCNCFVDRDGIPFNPTNLRGSKAKKLSIEKIKQAIARLN